MTTSATAATGATGAAGNGTDSGLRELVAVREIAQAFHTAKRAEEVFQLALDRVSPLVGASFAAVFTLEPGSDEMRLAAVHNWPQRYAKFLKQTRVRLGAGPSGEAASDRREIEVHDVFADASHSDWQEVAMELGFRAFVALPLETRGSEGPAAIGTVTFYFATPNAISDETRQLMRVVANQMAAAGEKTRLIADLREANVALAASHDQVERQCDDLLEARRLKDEFLANISHELRTPLTAVIGYVALMRDGLVGPVSDDQAKTLDAVKGASEQLLSLIANLLELTALKRGDIDLAPVALDPRALVDEAMESLRGRTSDVPFEVVAADDVGTVVTDRHVVVKALTALLDNAFKFTHAGQVRVRIERGDTRLVFRVEDSGPGIPAAQHAAVFDEFRQGDGSMTREFAGAGLGLALARRLARLIDGDITIESVPGTGSTFCFDLPFSTTLGVNE